ncbi:FAD-linked oxidase C-terminal domain-containing protein [Phyllobacterium endophyticum]|uniref:FAD-binding oxidoreductase n=1 Tax=Phyllobacterium endophyticum TaxID=1149773 RepID=A0A2P7B158_9HYPH|nr:FAD-linked oxidase C-terminal domain-containing protein [Phyllobacterium endophyticum]MBB3237744.1 glycolate oxidase [Phyllobacterium endophyticum]PSH60197.1 FAD-binding oxidoreductase [Phyllobacterium endophyticum]TXR48654.1 FAD-binding protein [Phyllobacterium endophyticum]TYR42365.1 FAD-binding protein [Phyllobacterium endophyticum]
MSGLLMPKADDATMARREAIIAALKTIVPGEGVVDATNAMRVFESDALTAYRQLPLVVVLPQTVAQVSQVLKYCHENNVKVVPRGSGTSLSGGALPLEDAVLLVMSRFNQILEIDYPNRVAVVQPGVTNLGITKAVEHEGFYYAPDPSSQIACSIGGNVAENSGGVHCLKYGLTANNVLGLEMVLISGEVIRLGGKHLDTEGYDLLGLMTGSEGLLGVVTEVTVRILQKPTTARALMVGFPTSEQAGKCVADIIAAGIIPGGMEMMDRPAIHAAEDFVHAGYPLEVEALLIIELDGPSVEVDHLINMVETIARENGASTCVVSQNEEERMVFWAGRKAAFPAVGRISPDYLCMDGTIPRKELPKVLAGMRRLSETYGLRVANVFHAGDGNLHPLILYDANVPEELAKAEAFGADILRLCVEVGGVLTGEHGVGVEKRDLMPVMFNDVDLNQQIRVKCAFDEKHLLNPGKVFPQLHRCAELGRMHVHRGKLPFPDIPRF